MISLWSYLLYQPFPFQFRIRRRCVMIETRGGAGGANVKDTLIGDAEAKRDATIAEALAEEQRMEAKLQNDTEIAKSKPLTTDPQQWR